MLISLILALLLVLQFDDELVPSAKEWLSQLEQEQQEESQAYLYLFGMMAGNNERPAMVGKERLIAYRQAEASFISAGAAPESDWLEFADYPHDKHLPRAAADSALYCQFKKHDCFFNLLRASGEWQKELQQHRELLHRYQTFTSFREYTSMSRPLKVELLPDVSYLIQGNRLLTMKALSLAKQHYIRDAQHLLLQDVNNLKAQLANTDTLVNKMVFAALLNNSLEVLSWLAQKYQLELALPLLTSQETGLKRAVIREFTLQARYYQSTDRHTRLLTDGIYTPGFLVRALFKPNMTINQQVAHYEELILLSRLSAAQFASYDFTPAPPPPTQWRNLIGSTLNQIAIPDFHSYVARLHDLNVKITLINHVSAQANGKNASTEFVNPYFPEQRVLAGLQGRQICLDGPFSDQRRYRCVYVYKKPKRKRVSS